MSTQSFISGFIISGVLGYFNYTLLANLGHFSSYNSKEDKAKWYSIFSLINYLIYLIVSAEKNSHVKLLKYIFFTIVISFFITIIVFPLINKFCAKLFSVLRSKKNLGDIAILTSREEAFESKGPIHVYIFDFDHKFIADGFLKNFSVSNDLENQMLLEPCKNISLSSLSENDVIEMMNDHYNKTSRSGDDVIDTKIYVDTSSKLKYYIFYY